MYIHSHLTYIRLELETNDVCTGVYPITHSLYMFCAKNA